MRTHFTKTKFNEQLKIYSRLFDQKYMPVPNYNFYLLNKEYLINLNNEYDYYYSDFKFFIKKLSEKQINKNYRIINRVHNSFLKFFVLINKTLDKHNDKNNINNINNTFRLCSTATNKTG